ncbi:hypothetical protein BDR26DRAFT_856930 [Obelidium mucronatum]|nr:hypothetical protein BDR26DRAFT_856930 [Obelidium mucronatum]
MKVVRTVTTERSKYRSGKILIKKTTRDQFEVQESPQVELGVESESLEIQVPSVERTLLPSSSNTSWMCAKQYRSHDLFLSYRVATDSHVVDALADSFGLNGLHPYLDHICLVGAQKWEDGFISGLLSSRMICLIVSQACVKSLRSSWDNVVLEWELAFDRQDKGLAVVIPLFLNEVQDDGDEAPPPPPPVTFPDLDTFPDVFHDHPKSPRQRTIRQIMAEIFSLVGVHVDVVRDGDTASVDEGSVSRIIQLRQLVSMQEGCALKPEAVSLTKKELQELYTLFGVTAQDAWVGFAAGTQASQIGELFLNDVLEWILDANSNCLIVKDGEPFQRDILKATSLGLTKTNQLAANIDLSRIRSLEACLSQLIISLTYVYPFLGRLILSQSRDTGCPSPNIKELFQDVVLNSLPLNSTPLVLIFSELESKEAFSILKAVWDLLGNSLLSPFKFLFLGLHTELNMMLGDVNVSEYDIKLAAQEAVLGINTKTPIPASVVPKVAVLDVVADFFSGNKDNQEADFVICCGSTKDLPFAANLRDALTLNGDKSVYIQDPACFELFIPQTRAFILYVFSNDLIGELNADSNYFTHHVAQGSDAEHCHSLPILLKRNESPFSIANLFKHEYKDESNKKIISNVFSLQGLAIDEMSVGRSIASIYQIRKLVLGLKSTGSLTLDTAPLSLEEDGELINWLNPAYALVSERRATLMEQYISGTRMWLVKEIDEWVQKDADVAQLLWINAKAGVGKSVMAALVADRFQRENALASSFFFKHDDQRLRTALSMVTTMAYSLAKWSPSIGRFLLTLKESETAVDFRSSPSLLFRQLVLDPLQEIADGSIDDATLSPVVLVVDALDECVDPNARADMLSIFATEFRKLPSFVRVIVTSRPEDDIISAFAASNLPQRVIEPSDSNNKDDARIVATNKLSKLPISNAFSINQVVEELLMKSGGLFVWLCMALRTLESSNQEISLDSINTLPSGLDGMYTRVFQTMFGRRTDLILGAVIKTISVALEPLSCSHLVHFCGINAKQAEFCVNKLTPVLAVDNGRFTFMHKSVYDFLSTPESCQDPRFSVDIKNSHQVLACSVLDVMCGSGGSDGLSYNMAGLIASELYDANKSQPLAAYLEYACKFWFDHILNAADPQARVTQRLVQFVESHLLHWIEAMARINELNTALSICSKFYNGRRWWSEPVHAVSNESNIALEPLFKDLYELVINFRDAIVFNPLQVYHSGLVWAPHDSNLYRLYKPKPPASPLEVKLTSSKKGGPLTFTGHVANIVCVVYSPDGLLIASGDQMGVIKVWAVGTGECIQTFEGDMYCSCITFSQDSKSIVSGSMQGDLTCWSVATGKVLQPFEGHSGCISAILVDAVNGIVVSASADKLVLVSCLETGKCLKKLKGHTKKVQAIALSRDSRFLLSGSIDKNVKLWALETGACLKTFKATDRIDSIAFGSNEKTFFVNAKSALMMWDLESGTIINRMEGTTTSKLPITLITVTDSEVTWLREDAVQKWTPDLSECTLKWDTPFPAFALSTDKTSVAGFTATSVHIWTLQQESHEDNDALSSGHSGTIMSAAISNVGTVVTGALDGLVKLWSMETGECLKTFCKRDDDVTSEIQAVAISLCGQIIVSGDYNKSVDVWAIHESEPILSVVKHLKPVECVAISASKSWIASGSRDTFIQVFQNRAGQQQEVDEDDGGIRLSGHTDRVEAVAFAPESDVLLISGSRDKSAKVWSIETGDCLWTLSGHTYFVSSISFSETENLVLYTDSGEEFLVWSLETGEMMEDVVFGENECGVVDGWLVKRKTMKKVCRIPDDVSGGFIQRGKVAVFYRDNAFAGVSWA